jgi:hypothetical protein
MTDHLDDGLTNPSRRTFLKATGAAALGAPAIASAADKSGTKNVIVGEGDYRYEAIHGWGELPDHIKWGETHGVTIDAEGLIYIKHRSTAPAPADAIVVFDPAGKYVRSFGKEYHGGGHGIDIRIEDGEEFLYLSDIKNGIVAKTSLTGEPVWRKGRPKEPGVYDDPAAKYSPTNVAFSPDGGFYIADGYGSNYIHQYDKDAEWIRTWGGTGDEPGKYKTPHGLWLDDRPAGSRRWSSPIAPTPGSSTRRSTASRSDGHRRQLPGPLRHPRGRAPLPRPARPRDALRQGQQGHHAPRYDPEWTKLVLEGFKMRGQPRRWEAGRFIHPHDACFDEDGNIFVVEWVATGRVTKLRHLS